MADEKLLGKVQSLSDLELAALLCLIAKEHCLISTEPDAVEELVRELQLLSLKVFGLASVVVNCTAQTTLVDFANGILLPQPSQPVGPGATSSAGAGGSSGTGAGAGAAVTSNPGYFLPLPNHGPGGGVVGGPSPAGVHHGFRQQAAVSSPPSSGASPSNPGLLTPPLHHQGHHHGQQQHHLSPVHHLSHHHHHHHAPHGHPSPHLAAPQIAPVVLARDLDLAPAAVQVQALELLRTRRIFTRTSVAAAPRRQFLFVGVLAAGGDGKASGGGGGRITPHLIDHFYISHWHDAEADGFANIEEEEEEEEQGEEWEDEGGRRQRGVRTGDDADTADSDADFDVETASTDSVVKRKSVVDTDGDGDGENWVVVKERRRRRGRRRRSDKGKEPSVGGAPHHASLHARIHPAAPLITEADVSALSKLASLVAVDVDVLRYQLNIVTFLRLHRAVAAGVSPAATRHLDRLVRSLAPLNGLDYATPGLVALAVAKVYRHRIELVTPGRERSLQWGSDADAVDLLLEGVGPDEVVEDVLAMVAAPL